MREHGVVTSINQCRAGRERTRGGTWAQYPSPKGEAIASDANAHRAKDRDECETDPPDRPMPSQSARSSSPRSWSGPRPRAHE
jgi:hypothetical protein